MTDSTILTRIEGPIGVLTLNRPNKKNALAGKMRSRIAEEIESFTANDEVRVVVLRGAGGTFCAGGDIQVMARIATEGDEEAFRSILESATRAVLAIRRCYKPVIAQVQGPAFGAGMNLALTCDIRIASETARFAQSFVRVGLVPDWGGSHILSQLVGPARATELIYTARALGASEALSIGIVHQVVSDKEIEEVTRTWAMELSRAPWLSLAESKRLLHPLEPLEKALRAETEAQLRCFRSSDAREGFLAFLEKRPARFESRPGPFEVA